LEDVNLRLDYFAHIQPGREMGYNWRAIVWNNREMQLWCARIRLPLPFRSERKEIEIVDRSLPNLHGKANVDQLAMDILVLLGNDNETIYYLTGGVDGNV
jgi:hypothetical protein